MAGEAGKRATVVIKNVRLVIFEESFVRFVPSAIDVMDDRINDFLENAQVYHNHEEQNVTTAEPYDADISDLGIASISVNDVILPSLTIILIRPF